MPNFSNYAEQLAAHTKIFHGKDTNKPSAKANFICILPRRSIQNEVKDTKIPLSFVRKKATIARFVRKIHPVPDLQSVRS